ncbi:MAG: hypothetical protein MSG64_00220 [Pyrinomonadaceae bacterium MAG19_C2-C3]|nr:hypothetical protein [Pyrinomonadaceae bacterium MAG19_C2-C3]
MRKLKTALYGLLLLATFAFGATLTQAQERYTLYNGTASDGWSYYSSFGSSAGYFEYRCRNG